MTTKIPTGRFVWFEYMSKDLKKAQGFFGELFNWTTQDVPMAQGSYTMIAAGGTTIGGYLPHKQGAPEQSHWLSHLQVEDAHASAKAIVAAGGKVRAQPVKMGDFGTWAVVADPLDGTFALWQPGKPEGTGDFKGQPNTFCWNELYTKDVDKTVAFYKTIGGFTENKMEMGPGQGTYHILESDGKGRAGIMKAPMPDVPQAWVPYVQVANTDQTHAKAEKLGAKTYVPPTDIPNVGRFAIFADPQGAVLGILQPPK
jgi:predicted enzyme related to lactoylglutathione lyase